MTPLSAGCLEAATMAGLQTAHAITGQRAQPILGDWMPSPAMAKRMGEP